MSRFFEVCDKMELGMNDSLELRSIIEEKYGDKTREELEVIGAALALASLFALSLGGDDEVSKVNVLSAVLESAWITDEIEILKSLEES